MVVGTARGTFLPCLMTLGHQEDINIGGQPMLGWGPGVPVKPSSPTHVCKQTTYDIQVTKTGENPLFDTL